MGRDDELSLIAELSGALAGGTGRALWVEGEPGIGKTTLCDILQATVAQRGIRTYRATASEPFQAFPLRTVVEALGISVKSSDPTRVETAHLLRGGGTNYLDPVLAASERILEIIDRDCSTTPAVLIVEDLQWSDEPTLLLWERLAHAVDQIPLVLVGTCYLAPLRPEVSRLRVAAHEELAVAVQLTPLSPEDVADLATRLLGTEPDRALITELHRAGGNPLYVREIVAGWRSGDSGQPSSLVAAIGRRLRFLGAPTRHTLRLAALLGREFEVVHLAAVTGRDASDLAPMLEQASAAGTLAEAGDRFVFRHELVRRVLAEEIPAPVRVALHAQLARTLARSGADVAVVARHLLVSDATLESWAIQWLAQIPQTAFFVAPQAAAELLSRAVNAPAAAPGHWEVLANYLVAVYFALGRDEDAEEIAGQVAREAHDPDIRARMQLYRIRLAGRRGRGDDAETVAEAALNDPTLSPVWSARIRARWAAVLIKYGKPALARRQASLSLAEATATVDPIGAGHSHLVLAYLCDPAGALRHFDTALVGLGADHDSTELRLLLISNRLAALNNLGRPAEFTEAVDEALIIAAKAGVTGAGYITGAAAMGFFDFGAWDNALVHLSSMHGPSAISIRLTQVGLAALIAGHREDWLRLDENVRAGEALPITAGDARILSGYLVAARALRAEADGDQTRAATELTYWLNQELKHDARERFMWLPALTRLAMTIGDLELAHRAAAAAAEDAAETTALIRQKLAAQFCRAQLDDDVSALHRLAATAKTHGWLMLQAAADEESAVRLAAGGDGAAGRAALGDAVRTYLTVGATFDIRRADARLRAYGIRRGPRSTHRRTDSGWEALTPTEARVAELVAAGRSNPDIAAELFMSRRTAQTHVSRVLRKLASSRLELIRSGRSTHASTTSQLT